MRLTLQAALVGQITPRMRLISFEDAPDRPRVIVYYDRELGERDRSDFEEEMAACFGAAFGGPPRVGPECHFVRCDDPRRVPLRGEILFALKGVSTY